MPSTRTFTRVEDELIIAQSQGAFSIHELAGMIKASRDTLVRRAEELGVELMLHQRPPVLWENREQAREKMFEARMLVDDGRNPLHVGTHDLLLQRLQDEHGDRRYEELDLRTTRKRRRA